MGFNLWFSRFKEFYTQTKKFVRLTPFFGIDPQFIVLTKITRYMVVFFGLCLHCYIPLLALCPTV